MHAEHWPIANLNGKDAELEGPECREKIYCYLKPILTIFQGR